MATIKGWKDTSKTYSDGGKSIEWRSKNSRVNIHDNTQFGGGWIVSVKPLRKNQLMPDIVDTNNTKQQAYRKAYDYMRKHPKG